MTEPLSAMIAGSKGFVEAVEAPLKMRLGVSPKVARRPEELSAALGGVGLVILEYAGAGWLEAIRAVRGQKAGSELSIIAAVSQPLPDVKPLQHAGVDEVVRWQGRVDPVLWAVDRLSARARASARVDAPPVLGAMEETVERGFDLRPISAEERSVSAPSAAPAVPEAQEPAKVDHGGVLWPLFVPSAAEAEKILAEAAIGKASATSSSPAVVAAVLQGCSEAERAALKKEATAQDPELLRAAAGLRLRLALALAERPAAPEAADQAAAQAMLADVDALLARIKAAMDADAEGTGKVYEPIRNAVVGGGVDLAGALSRLVPEGSPEQAALQKQERKLATTRLLTNEAALDDNPLKSTPKGWWIVLAVVLVLVGSYHAWRFVVKPVPLTPPTLPGAPANTTTVTRGPAKLLVVTAGKKVDPAELEKFRSSEQAKGNTLRELSAGMWVIEPGKAEGGGKP